MSDYGQRTIPHVVRQNAVVNPDSILFSFPKTGNPADGFHDVSNAKFANAVNYTAQWIERSFGKPEQGKIPAIGYIGPNDLRYQILQVSAVVVGFKMLYLSPKNTTAGSLAVIDEAKCNHWAFPQENFKSVTQILEARQMKAAQVPELLELLNAAKVDDYPFNKTFQEARKEPFIGLHTSGSTGLPKLVDVTFGSVATVDSWHLAPPVDGRRTLLQHFDKYRKDGKPLRLYSAFPLFHAFAQAYGLYGAVFYNITFVLGPAMKPVTPELVQQMIDHANVQAVAIPPSILQELTADESSIQCFSKLDYVINGGGPLEKKSGDAINARCSMINVIGSTEGLWFPTLAPDESKEWEYMQYHPYAGFTYKKLDNSELWEQFQSRDAKLELYQCYLQTYPHLDEVAVHDLYLKHPTHSDKWLYKGRIDDVIVLSNGEKLNPVDMEASINEHPAVKTSMVVGYGHFQPAVLVEPRVPVTSDEMGLQTLRSSLWQTIKFANENAPAHAQLWPDFIIFADPAKPFVLTGKGTLARRQTLDLYNDEIESFYKFKASNSQAVDIDGSSYQSILDGIKQQVDRLLPDAQLSINDDIFEAGMDSLKSLRVLTAIRPLFDKLNIDSRKLTARFIYANNTIEEIAQATEKLLRPNSVVPHLENDIEKMKNYLTKYTADLPGQTVELPQKMCLLITGTTGNFGTYILDEFYADPRVSKIYCLNRTADARERQIASNKARGLSAEFPADRFQFMHADLFEPNLGLIESDYQVLLKEVTHIIHNQWRVDFNFDIDSFELHIAGVRKLGNFAYEAVYQPTFMFVSSIASVKNQTTNDITPEVIWTDGAAGEGGYGCSKLVGEWILQKLSLAWGLNCSIVRVGQLAGPINEDLGQWIEHEWVPTLVASSKYLGMVPETLSSANRVDWLPVNVASKVLKELLELDKSTRSRASKVDVYHVVNPFETTWTKLLPAVTEFFGSSVPAVPWSKWLEALEKSEAQSDFVKNPGLKLLGFYQSLDRQEQRGIRLPILHTENTEAKSKILHSVGPITQEWMAQFMEDWGRGLLA